MSSPVTRRPAPPWARPVIILAPGRSGSTLLMRLVNCMEGITVWGEHAGIVRMLAIAHDTLTQDQFWKLITHARSGVAGLIEKKPLVRATRYGMTGEWMNPFDKPDLLEASRQYLKRLLTVGVPKERRWGFKEIRYLQKEFDFIKLMFPAAQTLLLVRDPVDVVQSQLRHFAQNNAKQLPEILRRVAQFVAFVEGNLDAPPMRVRVVDYADLVQDFDASIAALESFLGDRADRAALASIRAEPMPAAGASPFAAGGAAAAIAALAKMFTDGGVAVPQADIEACVRSYEACLEGIRARRKRKAVPASGKHVAAG